MEKRKITYILAIILVAVNMLPAIVYRNGFYDLSIAGFYAGIGKAIVCFLVGGVIASLVFIKRIKELTMTEKTNWYLLFGTLYATIHIFLTH